MKKLIIICLLFVGLKAYSKSELNFFGSYLYHIEVSSIGTTLYYWNEPSFELGGELLYSELSGLLKYGCELSYLNYNYSTNLISFPPSKTFRNSHLIQLAPKIQIFPGASSRYLILRALFVDVALIGQYLPYTSPDKSNIEPQKINKGFKLGVGLNYKRFTLGTYLSSFDYLYNTTKVNETGHSSSIRLTYTFLDK